MMKKRTVRNFSLSEKFLATYKEQTPPFGPIGYLVYRRTYARRLNPADANSEVEEWWQTCRRIIEAMFTLQKRHCADRLLPWNDEKAQRTAKRAYDLLFNLKWTPPGRGIWAMDIDLIDKIGGAALNSCAFRSTGDLNTQGGYLFAWMMDALMLGVGVGFDTEGAGTMEVLEPGSKYKYVQPLAEQTNEYIETEEDTICVIADSREGWVESTMVLLNAYFKGYQKPLMDYSQIRGPGLPIKTFGGTSSGPEPLRDLHERLEALYEKQVGFQVSDALIVDTENLIGRCVVSGNVRRSAALAMGRADSKQFLHLKDPTELHAMEAEAYDLGQEVEALQSEEAPHPGKEAALRKRIEELRTRIDNHPLRTHRWGSNNSINASDVKDFKPFTDMMIKNGEPGFIFLENARAFGRLKDLANYLDELLAGFNPCVEQGLHNAELCTLVENYLNNHQSLEEFLETIKISYLYAKTITLVPTHWPETNAVMQRNRRIGLSVTGFSQLVSRIGYREAFRWLDVAYEYIQKLDKKYSDWLCIPKSIKTTTVKPSGTSSKLAGASPGMHFMESEYYIQRIRFAEDSDMLPALQEAGYPIESCVYSPRTMVVSIPIKVKDFQRGKAEVSMWEQLEIAAQLQYYWSDNGVSVTVTFKEHEEADIPKALELYSTRLKAVSFLKYSETGYVQAPYEACTKDQYEAMNKLITPVTKIKTKSVGQVERFCTGESCTIDL